MKAIRLRTEYLVNPLGIDVQHPRLMWNCEGGVKQSAYQIEATVWSAKGNHLDIPTDCPTRERHGWTGDAQIFFETAAYKFT